MQSSPLPVCSRLPLCCNLPSLLEALQRIPADAWQSHFNSAYYQGDWSGVALISAEDAPLPLAPGRGAPRHSAWWQDEPAWHELLDSFQTSLRSARLLRLGPGSTLNLADEAPAPREEFIARRLGRLLQVAVEQHRQYGGLLLNYSELPMALGGRLRTMLGLDVGQVAMALESSGQNAKRPEQAFAADAQRKRDEASTPLREAVSHWAATPYHDLEALRLQQLG